MLLQILHHLLTKSGFLCYPFHAESLLCDWIGVVALSYHLALCFSIHLLPFYCTATESAGASHFIVSWHPTSNVRLSSSHKSQCYNPSVMLRMPPPLAQGRLVQIRAADSEEDRGFIRRA